MRIFTINTLSAHSRFHTIEEVEAALGNLVGCFKRILPALRANTAILVADPNIDVRTLFVDTAVLAQCLSRVRDKQLVRDWYLYVKNRAVEADATLGLFSMRASSDQLNGQASRSLGEAFVLVGFGGIPICDASVVELEHEGITRNVASVSRLDMLSAHFPSYEASPKHRFEAYILDGELVSPMTLTADDAQECLGAALEDGGDLLGIHGDKFVRFKMTHPGRLIYHGFEIGAAEVSAAIAAELLKRV